LLSAAKTVLNYYSTLKVHPRTLYEGPEGGQRYSSTLPLTSALDKGGWSTPRAGHFTPRERPCTYCTGGWVGPRAGLEGAENIAPTMIRSPDHPACSMLLY
jgi:hypothetical protein